MSQAAPASILVADDDPVSLLFFASALRELGCEVIAVANGTAALAACERQSFDLLLLDRCMPDFGGAELLRALRAQGCAVTAIATSAELDATIRDELNAAGYIGSLSKPIGVEQLARLMASRPGGWRLELTRTSTADANMLDLLDDTSALARVGGDASVLRSLRNLLVNELQTITRHFAIASGAMPTKELGDDLHRLRASCRYCGTPALGAAAAALEAKLRSGNADMQTDIADFLDVCTQTAAALRAQASSTAV